MDEAVAPSILPESAVICAFALDGQDRNPLDPAGIATRLDEHQAVWIHANLGNVGLVPWLAQEGIVPESVLEVLTEREVRHRLEFHGEGVLLVANDFAFADGGEDPGEVAPMWVWVAPTLVLTARLHALRTTDALRIGARLGQLPSSPQGFLVELVERQIAAVERASRAVGRELESIEDGLLKERASTGREELGRLRRAATSLRRHFRPLHLHLHRLLGRPPEWLDEESRRALRALVEDLAYLVEEATHQLEAAKLLQEELSARDAESTGRNLYVLTIYTAAFLPMTLITGVFGMNLSGMPWSGDVAGFWWVVLLILASGLSVLFLSSKRFL